MSTFESARSGLLWGATAVPNAFFSEYMPSAPEEYVKVYLYGLMCAHGGLPEESNLLDEVAQVLHMDRDAVDRAMRYWERCRLVERIQDLPPRYRYVSVQQVMLQREQMPRDDQYEAFAQAVYAAFGDRRKLHGGETVLAYEWVEQYSLPPEIVIMLIQHMIETRGVNFSFKLAQKIAMELCDRHITTLDEAETFFSRSEATRKGAMAILKHLGWRRNPTEDEQDLYLKWTSEWGFEPKAIREACRETTKGSPTFGYLDKVLEGIHSRTQGKATSEAHVHQALEQSKAETEQVRELLAALGISMTVIDDGLRSVYNDLLSEGSHEVLMLAAREVVRSGKANTLDNVKLLAEGWRKNGCATVEQVTALLGEVEKLNQQLRELADITGMSIGRNKANRDLLTRWQQEWRMPRELISLAAEFAHGKERPMGYISQLISSWHEAGISTIEEARAEQERRISQPKSAALAASAPKRVIEQQYAQRTYDPNDYDQIPEDLLEEMKKL